MPHIPLKNTESVSGSHKALFDQIDSTFGVIPNLFKAIGNSEAALESMWTSFGALGKGELDAKLGEQIAVLVADINRCEYCLAAHTALGQKAGASVAEMADAQAGKSDDDKTQAALDFSAKVVRERAGVSAADINALKQAGFSDANVAEIIAHIALNIFTNYTNVALDVPVDFPKVDLRSAA